MLTLFFVLAVIMLVPAALAIASGWWERVRHTLPARRVVGILLGGPFLLAACTTELPSVDAGPCAGPGERCEMLPCCEEGTGGGVYVCATAAVTGERACVFDTDAGQ